jgi:hypothetical protein
MLRLAAAFYGRQARRDELNLKAAIHRDSPPVAVVF